jgi:cytochrome P450
LFGEFPALLQEEPGQAHRRWLQKYRNPTGLISFPGLFYARQLLVTSSGTIQYVLNSGIYAKPPFAVKAMERVLGKGLLTAEGEHHKRQRKLLNPAFATGYIRDIVPIFSSKAAELVDKLLDEAKFQSAEGIDMSSLLSRSTLDIIGAAGLLLSNMYLM